MIRDSDGNLIRSAEKAGNSIVIKDDIAFLKYQIEKKKIERFEAMENEIANLKQELQQIKDMLNGRVNT